MAFNFQVVFDSNAPHPLADWWAEALGWEVEPSDEDFIRRMIAEGHASDDDTTEHRGTLVWKEGAAINHPGTEGEDRRRILFQFVPEPKTVKNRVHLDIRIGDENREAEVERLSKLGASVSHHGSQGPYTWVTMTDPDGNEFCVA